MTAAPPLEKLEIEDPRWGSFVDSQSDASPFHHPSWARLLAECYGFEAFALAALDGERVVAGAPVIAVTARRGRRRWVSLPFTDFCPPLLDGCPPRDFVEGLERLRAREEVAQVELRGPLKATAAQLETVAYRHVLALDPDVDRLFGMFQKSRVQRGIRQSDRSVADGRLTMRRADCERDVSEVFYGLHLATRRRLGVPVQPRRFFRQLWHQILEPGLGFALIAEAQGRGVAGAVFLSQGRTMVYKFGASERDAQKLRPNHLLMWSAIREACARGLEIFDFGRTDLTGESLREFKLGWGAQEELIVYSRFGADGDRRVSGRAATALAPLIRHSPPLTCRVLGELFYKRAA